MTVLRIPKNILDLREFHIELAEAGKTHSNCGQHHSMGWLPRQDERQKQATDRQSVIDGLMPLLPGQDCTLLDAHSDCAPNKLLLP